MWNLSTLSALVSRLSHGTLGWICGSVLVIRPFPSALYPSTWILKVVGFSSFTAWFKCHLLNDNDYLPVCIFTRSYDPSRDKVNVLLHSMVNTLPSLEHKLLEGQGCLITFVLPVAGTVPCDTVGAHKTFDWVNSQMAGDVPEAKLPMKWQKAPGIGGRHCLDTPQCKPLPFLPFFLILHPSSPLWRL